MILLIVLDTGVAGLLTHPLDSPESLRCRAWLVQNIQLGNRVALPEMTDYELRRDYLRRRDQGHTIAQAALDRLDTLGRDSEYVPLTTPAMRLAAQLWAQLRRQGQPTAPDPALDGDVILAAQALLLVGAGETLVIATTNPAHLRRLAEARLWTAI